MNWIFTKWLMALMAQALKQHTASGNYDGPFEAAYLGLLIAPTPTITIDSVRADLTEATYTGYARQLCVWDTTYISAAGLQTLEAASLHFQASDAVTPNVITALALFDAATVGHLLCGVNLPSPGIPLQNSVEALTVITRIGLDFAGNWGAASLIN